MAIFGNMCNHGIKEGGLDVTNLIEAAKSGDKRATLIALRDKLAETIENCDSGRDMASNSKRLMEVMEEIEALSLCVTFQIRIAKVFVFLFNRGKVFRFDL